MKMVNWLVARMNHTAGYCPLVSGVRDFVVSLNFHRLRSTISRFSSSPKLPFLSLFSSGLAFSKTINYPYPQHYWCGVYLGPKSMFQSAKIQEGRPYLYDLRLLSILLVYDCGNNFLASYPFPIWQSAPCVNYYSFLSLYPVNHRSQYISLRK